MRPDPPCPADLRDLTHGEHLVIWTMRAFATGAADCPLVARVFASTCGARADEARCAFLVFVQSLALRGRRTISVGAPGRLELTDDERLLAAMFADAQAGARSDFDRRLAALLGRPPQPSFFAAARLVTLALADRGQGLRVMPLDLAYAPMSDAA